jgi:hypothetical protein
MVDEFAAARKDLPWRWTRLFSAFKVALDLKKLLLAAAGILVMAAGWWLFAAAFYTDRVPAWADYKTDGDNQEAWARFKHARARWNLLHEMAGPAPADLSKAIRVDAADVADSLEEYELLTLLLEKQPRVADKTILGEIAVKNPGRADAIVTIYTKHLVQRPIKPFGKLRTWPFFEDRGPNQYLLIENVLRKNAPWGAGGQFLNWLVSEQLPVLIEPLVKFLAPIGYFFNSAGDGFRNRLYLILVILWTVATWAFFGGAICRIAAVQIARNEKISLREALKFAREKLLNLVTAPIFPLVFLGILTVFLIIFGWLIGFTVYFGDIFLAGPLFPIALLLGLIMAVVLVGLIGWPLMNPTIAAEGSDNFDALSRSYSYVYQAIWHYLWYWGVAIVYGAALIFFVGFMGSLVVYMAKWGLSQAPGLQSTNPASDRDPAYLFIYAPTSFQWRDLLIKDNPHAVAEPAVTTSGTTTVRYAFTEAYYKEIGIHNRIGAGLVWIWISLFFLLILGFGYSYFWTASTIIYFLVRKQVDDTDYEEVYFEEGEVEPPPGSVAPPAAAAAVKPTTSLNVVEPPPVAPPPPAAPPPPPPPPAPPAPAPMVTPTGDGDTPPPTSPPAV